MQHIKGVEMGEENSDDTSASTGPKNQWVRTEIF